MEVEARRGSAQPDITLSQIYSLLSQKLGWTGRQRDEVLATELEFERRYSRAVPGARVRVAAARAQGATVFFLSDMYLPSEFIRELLIREGFWQEGDALFVSGELGVAKHNGSMFAFIRETHEGIVDWTHFGDNIQGDYHLPRSVGISAVLDTRCALTVREAIVRGSDSQTTAARSLMAGAMRAARLAGGDLPAEQRRVWESGADIVGPLWYGFTDWCLTKALSLGLKRLYFVARDGQIFHRIAKEISASRGNTVDCRYLYGSRQAWHLAGLTHLDDKAWAWIFNRQRFLTLEQVMGRVGLDPARFKAELADLGLPQSSWSADLSASKVSALRSWIQSPSIGNAVLARAEIARSHATAYFEQEGMLDGEPYALVDIGWHGNMQRSLGNLLRTVTGNATVGITGLYFALMERPEALSSDVLYSYWEETASATCDISGLNVALLEMMAAADHGSVMGFDRQENAMIPIFENESNETALQWGLEFLQSGALEFVRHWLPRQSLAPRELSRLSQHSLLQLLRKPSRDEAETWGSFPHSGEQIERHKESIAPKLSTLEILQYILSPEIRPAGWWPEGSFARTGSLLLKAYLSGKALKKCFLRKTSYPAGLTDLASEPPA